MGDVRRLTDDQGLTLVELLVVMLILGVVGTVTTAGVVSGLRTTSEVQNRADAQAVVRTGVERLSRDLRMADPLRHATSTEVRLDVVRGSGVVHVRYVVTAAGARWDLVERHWNLSWDRYQADTQDPGEPPDRERTLISGLTDPDVFAFRDVGGTHLTDTEVADSGERARRAYSVELALHRFVGEGRSPVDVNTAVTIRNR